MKTAVVIEVRGNSAIVMKTGGEFVTIRAKQGWSKGDVVSIEERKYNLKAIYATAACFVLLLLGSLGGYQLYFAEAALISVDINPSIELRLNRFERVTSTTSYNADGEKVLSALDLQGKKYDEALAILFQSDALQPYLENNDYLGIAVFGNDAIKARIEAQTQSYAEHYRLQLSCQRADAETVAAAHEHGMTPGRYLAFLELQELDPNANIEDYNSCGLGQIRREIESHHQNRHGQSEGHGNQNQNGQDADDDSQAPAGNHGQEHGS